MQTFGFASMENVWMASDFDGAFAYFVTVPQTEVFLIDCDWSNAELATIHCAHATAETMLHRARRGPADDLLVTYASSGVGSSAVQLANRRGALVTVLTHPSNADEVRQLGADEVITRGEDVLRLMDEESVNLVVDNVAGEMFSLILKLLQRSRR